MTMYDKIAQMKPEQENHWFELPELTYWGERFFAEFATAEALATPEELPILEDAIDGLYESFCKEHALTDSACREAEGKLLCFSDRAKEFTLHHVAHAHIDMDWLWGLHETVDITLNTFRTMLDMMDEYPEFTFSQSQCAVYKMTKFFDPALFRRLKQRVKEGRFEFAGSTWVELDKNMPSLESMARHILYTRTFLKENFDIPFEDVNLDFHPDTFGHSSAIPEIFRAGGIKYFYHCRGLDGDFMYRWRGPSGAEVLTLNEPLWYNDRILPMYISQVPKVCRQYGVKDMMKIYGVGDHGGGPTRQDIERIIDMKSWPLAPKIIFSTYARYFASIEPYKDQFPVVEGELGPTFTGCYSSQSKIKMANRIGEDRLQAAETLAAFAAQKTGMEDFNQQFRIAWERILFNQFHDILPGSNIPESREHALGAFEEAMGCVTAATSASLRAFSDAIDTSMFETPTEKLTSNSEGGGVGMNTQAHHRFKLPGTERGVGKTRLLHFFNHTSFDREDVLEATLWDWTGDFRRIRATDARGNSLPVCAAKARHDSGHSRTDLLLKVRIPALSYTTVKIDEAEKTGFSFCELPPDPRCIYYKPLILENELVKVTFDPADLTIRSYVCKQTGKELLSPEGGRFLVYREGKVPKGGCAWVEGTLMEETDLHKAGTVLLKSPVSVSPLRQQLEYEIRYQESALKVKAKLDSGSPILELEVFADWRMAADSIGSPRLSFRTGLADAPDHFLSDSQIGMVQREPLGDHDRCSRNFFHAHGAGMTLMTDTKYGHRGYGRRMEVTLLRCSAHPDPYPEIGHRFFRIGLAASESGLAQLKELGSRFAHRDLPYASNRAHKGTLPLEYTFLKAENTAVSAVKLAEDGNGLILRLTSLHPETRTVVLAAPGITCAWLTDLSEQNREEIPVANGTISVSLDHDQVLTLRLV